MEEKKAAYGCMLGRKLREGGCDNCESCGWNPKVTARRKADIRHGVIREKTRLRLTAQRKTAHQDADGWYSVHTALPDEGERVIVTDGVFVGEAMLGHGGMWRRYGVPMVTRMSGIFPPIAWRPMPEFIKEKRVKK